MPLRKNRKQWNTTNDGLDAVGFISPSRSWWHIQRSNLPSREEQFLLMVVLSMLSRS